MRITSSGNVGIGTTSPGQALEVAGGMLQDTFTASGATGYGLQVNAPTGATKNYAATFMSGNVGIGTTNPTEKLSVVGGDMDIGSGSYLHFNGAGGSNKIASVSDTFMGIFGYGNIILTPGSGGSGNVGIGTTAPGGLFDTAASYQSYTGGHSIFTNVAPATTAAGQQANTYFNNFNNLTGILVRKTSTGTGDYLAIEDSSNNGILYVKSSGNVGIGTTAPSQTLEVAGGMLQDTFTASGATGYGLQVNAPTGATKNYAATFMNGNVGIGTASPITLLQVNGNNGFGQLVVSNSANSTAKGLFGISGSAGGIISGDALGDLDFANTSGSGKINFSAGASAIQMSLLANGNVGIGTTSPGYKLEVNGTAAIDGLVSTSVGDYVCIDATTHQLVQGTAVCSLSSEKFKTNIQDLTVMSSSSITSPGQANLLPTTPPADLLAEVMALRPVSFQYKQGYGDNGATTQLGFIAEEAVKIDPRLVVFDSQNQPSGFNYPTYTAVLTSAIQEMNLNLEAVAGTVTPLPGSASESFVAAFMSNIYSKIGAWLADATNGIADIFSKEIDTKSLCVSDDTGAKTCITKAQLDSLLSNAGTSVVNNTGNTTPPAGTPPPQGGEVNTNPRIPPPSVAGTPPPQGGTTTDVSSLTPPPQGGEVNTNSTDNGCFLSS